jgi:hypothetical protein
MAVALISVFSGLERTLGIFRRANFNSSGVAARRPRHDPRSALAIAGAGCMRSYGCVRVSLPLRPDDRVGHAASRFSEVGFETMKMGAFFCCLDAQNGLTFTGTARRGFSPLSAGSSVLDALWIVAIILEHIFVDSCWAALLRGTEAPSIWPR